MISNPSNPHYPVKYFVGTGEHEKLLLFPPVMVSKERQYNEKHIYLEFSNGESKRIHIKNEDFEKITLSALTLVIESLCRTTKLILDQDDFYEHLSIYNLVNIRDYVND